MKKHLDWSLCTALDFESIDPKISIAILPTAAVEQHGPHLPVGTDSLIMSGMLSEFKSKCPSDLDPWILPIQTIGKSNEHLWAKGTLTMTAATAISAWTEIGLSIARAGFRKIVIVNSHGGNLDLISILARELRVEAGLLAVKCQWSNFGHPIGMYSDHEKKYGIHGGDIETSLMLNFEPESVAMSKAIDFRSTAEKHALPSVGPVSYGWIASDLNPKGTVGNASIASAEKGHSTAIHQVVGFIDLLRKVRDMPVPNTPTKL